MNNSSNKAAPAEEQIKSHSAVDANMNNHKVPQQQQQQQQQKKTTLISKRQSNHQVADNSIQAANDGDIAMEVQLKAEQLGGSSTDQNMRSQQFQLQQEASSNQVLPQSQMINVIEQEEKSNVNVVVNGNASQQRREYRQKQQNINMIKKQGKTPPDTSLPVATPPSQEKPSKSEMRLRNSQHQFIKLADDILSNYKGEEDEVKAAMQNAGGYNIISSKSTKALPMTTRQKQARSINKIGNQKTLPGQVQYQQNVINFSNTQRLRVSESVQNMLHREEVRDQKLATRLKVISEKQAARIKEVQYEEMRNELEKISRVEQESGELKIFNSAKKEKLNNSQQLKSGQYSKVNVSKAHVRNESGPFMVKRGRGEEVPQSMMKGAGINTTNQDRSTSNWADKSKSQQILGFGGKERADVSFLQEKASTLVSGNAAKKMAIESSQGVLLSQSQLTTGNEAGDGYLQIALGLRQIGKSIMDMPKTLDDLRLLSREYMKNLGANDDLQDEQVYLQYIEDHLQAQEKASGEAGSKPANSALSPIRNLAEFYQKKLNKIESASVGESLVTKALRTTPLRNHQVANKTYVDIERMTVLDFEKLEHSPPTINPRRKNMKIVNNRAMTEFGSEAFSIKMKGDGSEAKPKEGSVSFRLHSKKPSTSQLDEIQSASSTLEENSGANTNVQLTPHNKQQSNTRLGISRILQKGGKSTAALTNAKSGRQKLLQSLNDMGDQLTKPSIAIEEKEKPSWFTATLKEEAVKTGVSQSNLGKPSSRQDATLLAKWFKGIVDMIETEQQKSQNFFQKHGAKKTFPSQKNHQNEMNQADSYLLIQIAHNIAIKEMTRQVSVQCIERGILLKTIFDSYVRMVDLIFIDSVAQRKLLAQKFATVCERQVYYQAEQIHQKDRIIDKKNQEIAELKFDLELASGRELAIKMTNKKLTTIAARSQAEADERGKMNLIFERQVQYLEMKYLKLCEQVLPEQKQIMQLEAKKALRKISVQANIDHDALIAEKKKEALAQGADENGEQALINGEVIKTRQLGTDVEDFDAYLEDLNGGPLRLEIQQQTSDIMCDRSNSAFDLYEIGAIHDEGTAIDPFWRRQTRPKRTRPKSATDKPTKQIIDQRIQMLENVSFDTSSHHTIEFVMNCDSKSFTFGREKRYNHLKQQRPVKRAISAGNFNWNLLVDRIDKREERYAEDMLANNAGNPMSKLIEILGEDLLEKIKNEIPELYEQLIDFIRLRKQLTYAWCKSLLANYNINLEEERKLTRKEFAGQYFQEESEDGDEEQTLNMSYRDSEAARGSKKKERNQNKKGYQFIEWNFQKRVLNKKDCIKKDHPSFNIVNKLLEKFKQGKEIKEMMPVKGALRVIFTIYKERAAELALEKANELKKQKAALMAPAGQEKHLEISAPETEKAHQSNNFTTGSFAGQKSPYRSKVTPFKNTTSQQKEEQENGDEKGQDVAQSQNLIEWAYESFQHRYGLKNVADKKFSQFIGSVLKYKAKHQRFKLFGRFLRLHDELNEEDIKMYIEIVQTMFKVVLNFQIPEQEEAIWIPTARCVDYMRMTLGAHMTTISMANAFKMLKANQVTVSKALQDKYPHLKSVTQAVELDHFAELVIGITNKLQSERIVNIQDIFQAADLSGGGMLDFTEFKTIYKVICNQQFTGDPLQQMIEMRNYFNEYSQAYGNMKGIDNIKIRMMNQDNFERLCLEKDVMTIRQQNSLINVATKTFLNVSAGQETFLREFDRLSSNLNDVHAKLTNAIANEMDSEVVLDVEKARYQDMVEHMSYAVMNHHNKRIAFLTFKIVEETIKRTALKIQVEKLMPIDVNALTIINKALAESSVNLTENSDKRERKATPILLTNTTNIDKNETNESNQAQFAPNTMSLTAKGTTSNDYQSIQEKSRESKRSARSKRSRRQDIITSQMDKDKSLETPSLQKVNSQQLGKIPAGINSATQSLSPNIARAQLARRAAAAQAPLGIGIGQSMNKSKSSRRDDSLENQRK